MEETPILSATPRCFSAVRPLIFSVRRSDLLGGDAVEYDGALARRRACLPIDLKGLTDALEQLLRRGRLLPEQGPPRGWPRSAIFDHAAAENRRSRNLPLEHLDVHPASAEAYGLCTVWDEDVNFAAVH